MGAPGERPLCSGPICMRTTPFERIHARLLQEGHVRPRIAVLPQGMEEVENSVGRRLKSEVAVRSLAEE